MNDPGATIDALILDIDGVLTDGRECVGKHGAKSIFLRDIDALTEARRQGLQVAFLTGEDGPEARSIVERCGGGEAIFGCKKKLPGLETLAKRLDVPLGQICYVADADRDAEALLRAGVGAAPADASPLARSAANVVLKTCGGCGAVAEAVDLAFGLRKFQRVAEELGEFVAGEAKDSLDAHRRFLEEMPPLLTPIIAAIVACAERGGRLYLFGNGGSAADAQHAAAEFIGAVRRLPRPVAAMALTTDTSVLTALSNDLEFEDVFRCQIEALAKPGDVAVGISTSGASPDVLNGIKAAADQGVTTIGFTGTQGRYLSEICQIVLAVPAISTARIQELHILAWHIICEGVERILRDRV